MDFDKLKQAIDDCLNGDNVSDKDLAVKCNEADGGIVLKDVTYAPPTTKQLQQLYESLVPRLEVKDGGQRIKVLKICKNLILELILRNQNDEESVELLTEIMHMVLARTKDVYCVLPAIQIILTVLERADQSFKTANFVVSCFKAISWPNLNAPSYNFSTRNTVLRIYEAFTLNKDLMKHVEPALFISCSMSAVEGEGDPRNLLLVFELERFVLANFCHATQTDIEEEQLEQFMEDIVDKVSCYFPINFEPPKDDRHKIQPGTLKQKMNEAFLASSHPYWLQSVFPFILEKLTAVQEQTRLDCIHLLTSMIVMNLKNQIQEHVSITVSSLQNEYFNRFEVGYRKACLEALGEILSQSELQIEKSSIILQDEAHREIAKKLGVQALSGITREVLSNCLGHVARDPSGHEANMSSLLMAHLVSSYSEQVATSVLFHLLYVGDLLQIDQHVDETRRLANFQIVINILEAVNECPLKGKTKSDTVAAVGRMIEAAGIATTFLQGDILKRDDAMFEKGLKLVVQLSLLQQASQIKLIDESFLKDALKDSAVAKLQQDKLLNQVICEQLAKLPQHLLVQVSEFILEQGKLGADDELDALLAKNGLVQTTGGLKVLSTKPVLLKEAIQNYLKDDEPYLIELIAKASASQDKHLSRQLLLKISDTAALTKLFVERNDFVALQKLLKWKSGVTLDLQVVQGAAAQYPKLAFYWVMRVAGRKLPEGVYQWLQETQKEQHHILTYWLLKAMLVRGDAVAFETIANLCNDESFDSNFAAIICKKVSSQIDKQNGYPTVNKMYAQRLFSVLYDKLKAKDNSQTQLMHLCSIVQLNFLQNQGKLEELIPIAMHALKSDSTELVAQETALRLVQKILTEGAVDEQRTNEILSDLVPSIIARIDESSAKGRRQESAMQAKLKIQMLDLMHSLIEKYAGSMTSLRNQVNKKLMPALKRLLDDKRRVVRKFARQCINAYNMI